MAKVKLAFLWHMHQPLYREPQTGEYLMPWVRLHATRAYNDMAAALERHQSIRCTVNFTPVLLEQLEEYARGVAKDQLLELSSRPAADLNHGDRKSILRSFFMVDWETCIRPWPRYWELLQKRGRDLRQIDLDRVAERFTDTEIADLQVLFNLAWMGFAAYEEDGGLRALKVKGRGYLPADTVYVLAAQRRILEQVIPRWRRLAERGQVELSTTPYYHPILPLVCDSDIAALALPDVSLPPRFAWPQDAHWQVRAARDSHVQRFGRLPEGMWPAEGSVSPQALELLAVEGLRWAASDEDVLLRSLPKSTPRTGSLYRPWRVAAGENREIAMLFRDRGLSDLIGFTYGRTPAKEAVADLISHLIGIGEAWKQEKQGGHPTVGVFLDGENPWEHYPDSGRDFLETLFHSLETNNEIETTTLAQATTDVPGPVIQRIHAGSWIEASYRIWIGHQEDRLAWTALGRAREMLAALERAGNSDAERLAQARQHLYVAEGSDWYWWYGEDFTSELAAEFDSLFRGQIIKACERMGVMPPFEALTAIKRVSVPSLLEGARPSQEPALLIHPVVDGAQATYFEWNGAGVYQPGQYHGSMYGGAQAFRILFYGYDLENFYLRLDPVESPQRVSQVTSLLRLAILTPDHQIHLDFDLVPDGVERPGWHQGLALGRSAFRQILELSVPFGELELSAGHEFAFSVHVMRGEVELERLPRYGFLPMAVPGPDFEQVNWRV